MTIHLPTLNACLNATAAVFLIGGFLAIKKKNINLHRAFMGAATLCSLLFLTSYVYYHAQFGSTPFQGQGWIRTLYFTILIPHTILAAVLVPLVLTTLTFAAKQQFDRHARLARWTWPVWMFVSVTGVLVYWMLYRL